jgi:RHS repeat-associated protein
LISVALAYEAFGTRRFVNGATDTGGTTVPSCTDRGFTGHEEMDEVGLVNMNGRIYDATLGRFMSADSGIPYPLDLQSYNRYSYGRDNPQRYIDPSGFDDISVPQLDLGTYNYGADGQYLWLEGVGFADVLAAFQGGQLLFIHDVIPARRHSRPAGGRYILPHHRGHAGALAILTALWQLSTSYRGGRFGCRVLRAAARTRGWQLLE